MATLTPTTVGTLLGVWAHPDDEAYLSAGLMALARRAGQRVVVLTATAGEAGTPDPDRWPPERLAPLRRRELAASLACLGVDEHHVVGHADGGCAEVPADEGEALVASWIRRVRPDTVVTFGPEGMTGHPDHRTVSAWTTAAWRSTGGAARLLHATVTPEFHARWGDLHDRLGVWGGPPPCTPADELALHVELDDHLLDRKEAALRAHRSQAEPLIEAMGPDDYRHWWATESFVDATDRTAPS